MQSTHSSYNLTILVTAGLRLVEYIKSTYNVQLYGSQTPSRLSFPHKPFHLSDLRA